MCSVTRKIPSPNQGGSGGGVLKEIKVDEIFVHESYNLTLDQVQANDIALLRLGDNF